MIWWRFYNLSRWWEGSSCGDHWACLGEAFDKSLECWRLQRQAQITTWRLKCFLRMERHINCVAFCFCLWVYRFGVEVSCSVKQRWQEPALFERKIEKITLSCSKGHSALKEGKCHMIWGVVIWSTLSDSLQYHQLSPLLTLISFSYWVLFRGREWIGRRTREMSKGESVLMWSTKCQGNERSPDFKVISISDEKIRASSTLLLPIFTFNFLVLPF